MKYLGAILFLLRSKEPEGESATGYARGYLLGSGFRLSCNPIRWNVTGVGFNKTNCCVTGHEISFVNGHFGAIMMCKAQTQFVIIEGR